jgi:hypothetical protein
MTAAKWARADEQVELVAWRGSVSALAARLRLSPVEIARLRAAGRTARPGFLAVDVQLHNTEIVLSALRHRLTPAPNGKQEH